MNFKTFIEMDTLPIPSAENAMEIPPTMDMVVINDRLESELSNVESPENGLEKIANVLVEYSINLPVPDDLEEDDDEFVIELKDNLNLYVIYVQNDNGLYDFHAEVIDDEGLEEILEDESEDSEE